MCTCFIISLKHRSCALCIAMLTQNTTTNEDDGLPHDALRSPNNSSEHKSSVRPEGSRAGHPRIIVKRYCLGSIDLAYKMLGYRCCLRVVKSEGGPE